MKRLTYELLKLHRFYVATSDHGRPDIRPFSSVMEYKGRTYLTTDSRKKCYRQFLENPNICICGLYPSEAWLRADCELEWVDDLDAINAMIYAETGPGPQMYTAGDGLLYVFAIRRADCTIYEYQKDSIFFTESTELEEEP